jgi:hypothetical protein
MEIEMRRAAIHPINIPLEINIKHHLHLAIKLNLRLKETSITTITQYKRKVKVIPLRIKQVLPTSIAAQLALALVQALQAVILLTRVLNQQLLDKI